MAASTYSAQNPSGSVPFDTGGAWVFYGERVVLFHKTIGLLSFAFFVVMNSAAAVFGPGYRLENSLTPDNLLHLLAATISIAIWLALRKRSLPARVVPGFDCLSTIAVLVAYEFSMVCGKVPVVARVDLVLMLIAMIVQMTRAIMVPSAARQTLWIGVVTAVGSVGMTHWFVTSFPHEPGWPSPFLLDVNIAMWNAITVTVAVMASRVVYGLHQQVREAQQLGQYTLDEKIGEGGMGIVYRAHHALLRRPTAVKLLPPERAGEKNLSRFEREVQLTACLTHPNTVAIYDYGHTPDGVFYYAMEYLDGMDLEELVETDGAQDPARVVHVLRQVCGALAEAHGVGLVHRDIKPANILLCERGGTPDTAKVVDFGLVKELSPNGPGPGVSTVNNLTGTPLYLSPEAITAPEKLDGRSDLYALGAVGYFLLTGKPVFEGETLIEVCSHHLHTKPVPPSERLGRPLPPKLEAVILRCLAKSAADRPSSASALKEELEQCAVPAWSDAQARAWWNGRKRVASGPQPRKAARPRTVVANNLTIDLRKRAAG